MIMIMIMIIKMIMMIMIIKILHVVMKTNWEKINTYFLYIQCWKSEGNGYFIAHGEIIVLIIIQIC